MLTIPVRRRHWRAEEAHMESVAFMDEVRAACARLVHAALADAPHAVINEANRLAYRAEAARRELMDLTEGGAA